MKDRIKLLMEDRHLTQQNFAQLLEISPAQLSGIYNGRTKPTLNIVDAIHRKFPQVRTEWLLYGIAPMYINMSSKEDGSVVSDTAQPEIEGMTFNFADDKNRHDTSASSPSVSNIRHTTGSQMRQGSLFDQPQQRGMNEISSSRTNENVKYIDKHQRKITEIRIFYDDQTWETFVPKK